VTDSFGAQWSYENLRFQLPTLECGGLWRLGTRFLVHVPGFGPGLKGPDGRALDVWFRDNSVIGAPVSLVAGIPSNATRVPERTIDDVASLRGSPRTIGQLFFDLSLALPRTFPPFTIADGVGPPAVSILVDSEVGAGLQNEALACLGSMGLPYEFLIERSPGPVVQAPPRAGASGELQIIPSRALGPATPASIRQMVEQDEDEWLDRRQRLFATDELTPADILPSAFREGPSRCVVSTTFPPRNIRVLLSLYDVVTLVCPIENAQEESLAGLGVTEDELLQLIARERVQFLLPQSADRYRQSFLGKVADCAPHGLLLSRALAAATVTEVKRRAPYLFPPLGMQERVQVLAALAKAVAGSSGPQRTFGEVLLSECTRQWLIAEEMLHRRGAMAGVSLGLSPIIAELLRRQTGRELFLEMVTASQVVEWSAVLRATAVPGVTAKYSEQNVTELCASAYSGVSSRSGAVIGQVDEIALGVLAIDNDAPVMDVADAFSGDDVNRFRKAIHGIADESIDKQARQRAITAFNERVTKYEKSADRIAKLDLAALAGALGSLAAGGIGLETLGTVGLGTWLLKRSLTGPSFDGKLGGRLMDAWRGAISWTTADVVLVSRIRSKVPT